MVVVLIVRWVKLNINQLRTEGAHIAHLPLGGHGIATRKRDRKGTETLKLWGRHQLPTLPTILEILMITVCSLL